MNPNPPPKDGPLAMWVILAGLAAMTVVTLAALIRYDQPEAIVTALGPVTGIIGTLVGAYFGLRGSSLAQQHANAAEASRVEATATAAQPAATTIPADGTVVVGQYDGDGNGNGHGPTYTLAQFKALDDANDVADDPDEIDPEDVPVDDPPDDEGDDREAHGVRA
jgi:hypothetical protein